MDFDKKLEHETLSADLLEYPTNLFNSLFNRLGLDIKPNIIIASIVTYSENHDMVFKKVTMVSNYYGNLDGELVDMKLKYPVRNPDRDEMLLKGITDILEKQKNVIIENYNYSIFRLAKTDKPHRGNQCEYKVVIVELPKNNNALYNNTIKSINYWYFNSSHNFIDEKLVQNGQIVLESYINNTDKIRFYEVFNNISLLKYEGAENQGKILFNFKDSTELQSKILLEQPVELTNYRAIRKLLEISKNEMYLLSDGVKVLGFGKPLDSDDKNTSQVVVRFSQHGKWVLENPIAKPIMSVVYGVPFLPRFSISKNDFESTYRNHFGEDAQLVWEFVVEAQSQNHGTMLVITDGAKEEAERLSSQSFKLKSQELFSKNYIYDCSSIDGALLFDPKGVCHAIGVILDGQADQGIGNIARGARYNSALKYINGVKDKYKCLIVIISEDGMIDIKTNQDVDC
ncbi:hypothetical protein [Paenibacillus sp. WC2504]|uniref:hypothetical protein n=1 Tax=Paenibacillus sp. WC2504 TaxID=3461403 RepID=UPI004045A724